MKKKVFVFLAEGFEEIEALTPVDMLRRGGAEVVTVGLGGGLVTGAHGIAVKADITAENFTLPEDAAMVVLPGGMPGTVNLGESQTVRMALKEAGERGIFIGAICAAPAVLEAAGLLEGKRFTAFPGKLEKATGAAVGQDGTIITARSAGVALEFSRILLAALLGTEAAEKTVAKVYPGP